MKAVFLEHQAPGGARTPLEDRLPLSTPYVLQFFPIYACNFVCKYCHFSIEKEKRSFNSSFKIPSISGKGRNATPEFFSIEMLILQIPLQEK